MAAPTAGPRSLQAAFDPRANGLNLIRLVLAIGVVLWHSFPLTGRTLSPAPLHSIAATLPVDGFFAISGYLILGSWIARPDAPRFLAARALRILPGYWGSLVLTVAVIAPVGLALSSGIPAIYLSGALEYVATNAGLAVTHYDIAGTPSTVPYAHVWNGSIWTLWYEALCYLAVLALGLLRLVDRRHTALVVFGLVWIFAAVQTWVAPSILSGPLGRLDLTPEAVGRLGVMFAAGMMVRRYERALGTRGSSAVLAGALLLVSVALPRWELVGALPLAYLLMRAGAAIRSPRLQLRTDLSYGMYVYAFPVQQVIAGTALVALPPLLFGGIATVLTVPFAALSWFLIEHPAKRLIRFVPKRPVRVESSVEAH